MLCALALSLLLWALLAGINQKGFPIARFTRQ
jgi:hypothetical protein